MFIPWGYPALGRDSRGSKKRLASQLEGGTMKLLPKKIFLFLLFSMIFPVVALADPEKIITATISPTLVSLTIDISTVDYGAVPLGTIDRAPLSDPKVSVIHNGNVNEDFKIRGSNAVSNITWTLAVTPGSNQYVHKYGMAIPPAIPDSFTPMTVSNGDFATDLAPSESRNLKLRISTPTSTSSYSQLTTSVYLTALQH